MLSSFIIRTLFIVGCTLLPILLVNLWYTEEVCHRRMTEQARREALREGAGTRYAFLIIAGSIALAIMLSINASL